MSRLRSGAVSDTTSVAYTERMLALQGVWWKRILPVQAPYRWHLRHLRPGFVLDIGCGIGRNLAHLRGQGVGVDHNPESVSLARRRGFQAFTPNDFLTSEFAREGRFDSLLLSHVAEHMAREDALRLIASYLPFVRTGGAVILITPQEAGFRSDDTHVTFLDTAALDSIGAELGLAKTDSYSFPLPRPVGKVFLYNEFVWVGLVRASSTGLR